jgi:hypothetical protein
VLEKHKNGLPVTRKTRQMKELEVTTSLKIPQRDFKTAWNDMSPESIIKGFKKCCVSNDTEETEDDDVLWEEYHAEKSF